MEEIQDIIAEYQEQGIELDQEEVDDVLKFCKRKMDVAKVIDPESYLPLLFRDEIKNYLFRRACNVHTFLMLHSNEILTNHNIGG